MTSVNANGETILNYYIFKEIRPCNDYLVLYENDATYEMQKKEWMDAYQFTKWMDHFLYVLREKVMTSTHRHLLILDGHKAYLTLDVLTKVKKNGINMLTIPSHTSHGL